MPTVSVPGLGEVEFPEGTPKEVMETAIRKKLGQGDPYQGSASSPTQQIATAQLAQTAKELAAGANRDVAGMSLPEALATPSRPLLEAASSVKNPILRGAAEFGASIPTAANALMLGGGSALGEVGGRLAGGIFGAKFGIDALKSFPSLWRLYKSGDYDKLQEEATKLGLGGIVSALGLRYAVKGGAAPEATAPKDVGALEAAKTAEKVASAIPDEMPETRATAKANVELQKEAAIPSPDDLVPDPFGGPPIPRWAAERNEALRQNKEIPYFQRPHFEKPDPYGGLPIPDTEAQYSYPVVDEMRPAEIEPPQATPEGAPPTVERAEQKPVPTAQGPVVPNERPSEPVRQNLDESLDRAGVDVSDPQHIADHLGEVYGLKKPVKVEFTDEKVSSSYDSPDFYLVKIPKGWTPDMIAHEIQHARVEEGKIGTVPEGAGANDQISTAAAIDSQMYQGEKFAANINLNRLAIPGEAKQTMLEASTKLPERQSVTWAETAQAASELGMNAEQIRAFADATKDLHVQATAARDYEAAVAVEATKAFKAYAANPADPTARAYADKAMVGLLRTMEAGSDVAANMGRGLSSFNIKAEPLEVGVAREFADLINEIEKGGKDASELKAKLMATDLTDPAQRVQLRTALASKNATLKDKIGFYYVNSILSAIPTLGKKISWDVTSMLLAPLEKAAGGKPGSAAAGTVGRFSGLDDAFQAMTEAWRGESRHFHQTPPIGGVAGKIIGTPVRDLAAVTDFARQMHVRGSLYEQGYELARSQGKTFKEAMALADETAKNPTPEQLDQAQMEANNRVLLTETGPFGKALYQLRKSTPLGAGRLIGPVLQIPLNVAKYGVEMTPAGLLKNLYDVSRGRPVTDIKMGRSIVGSSLFAYAYSLAAADKITGSGPTDPTEKARLQASGWKSHSFHAANGEFYPLYWLGPVGFVIGMAADLNEIIRDAPRAATAADVASMVGAHAARFMLDQPYMQGLSNFIEALHDPTYRAARFFGGIAGGFVPSIVARAGAAMDPYERRMSEFMDSIKARVPFLREELPPKRDLRGRPLPAPGTPAERFLSPMAESKQLSTSPADLAAARAKIGPIPGFIKFQEKNLKLDPVDRDRLEELAGKIVDRKFNFIDKAPSAFLAMPGDRQEQYVKDIVSGARAEASMQLLREMKKRGTLAAYTSAAAGKAAAKAQTNPYVQTLSIPGEKQAQDVLDRYQIPSRGLPPQIPEDLVDEYQNELSMARAQFFHPIYAKPEEFGSMPPEEARKHVQKIDDIATNHAIRETLRKANLLKKVAAGAQ